MLTRAEATNYRETSLHADVMAFVEYLSGRKDARLFVSNFGSSPQGRELPLLVLSARGIRTPAEARRSGLPVVLLVDGIHPGEVEGKEATLALIRDILDGKEGDFLEHLTLVVVPLFNPDGNDALDPVNRRLNLKQLSGQIGPVVGTRTQSHGINLNRDYLRQAAPEMRLFQSNVCIPWQADVTIDNHATNGSLHRFHMTVDVPHTVESGRREPIEYMRNHFVPEVITGVAKRGFNSGWYGNFVEDERSLDAGKDADAEAAVREGWMTYPHNPRFGANYRGLTNRMDLLLECYSYLPFEERVATARAWQIESLQYVARNGSEICETVASSARPPDEIAIRYRLDAFSAPVEILTRTPRTLEGAESSVSIPHFAKFVGTKLVKRPMGYLVPPQVGAHLSHHGLRVGAPPTGGLPCEIARVEVVAKADGRGILEAATVGDIQVSWRTENRSPPPGWQFVATEQPLGAIATYLCEPESDDGAVENCGLIAPNEGEEFGIWRVTG